MEAIRIWGLVALVLAARVLRRSAGKVPKKICSVAVFQMAKLGDMVCTTPLLRAVKESFPGAELSVFGNAVNAEVLAGNPDVTRYVVFDGVLSVAATVRGLKVDVGLVCGPDVGSVAAAFLGGARCVVAPRIEGGYSPLDTAVYRALRQVSGAASAPHAMGAYAPREYLRLLEPFGVLEDDTSKRLFFSEVSRRKVADFLADRGVGEGDFLVGVSPSAGNKVKEWGADNFAELAVRLARSAGVKILVTGGPRDVRESDAMLAGLAHRGLGEAQLIDATLKFSIDELKALIARLGLFVAVDTGPIYIAEAFGVPTVDIVGPIDEREQPPIGARHLVVVPPGPRVPQMFVMNAHPIDEAEARRQASSITVSQVFEACEVLLGEKFFRRGVGSVASCKHTP